jgi:hypothetical protein
MPTHNDLLLNTLQNLARSKGSTSCSVCSPRAILISSLKNVAILAAGSFFSFEGQR